MRWTRIAGALLVAAVVASALVHTCEGPPPELRAPPSAPRVGSSAPSAPPAPVRRRTPRAVRPDPDDVSAPPTSSPPPSVGDASARTVTIRVVSATGAALEDLRVRAWTIRHDPLTFDALGGEVRPGPDGVATFTAQADTPRVGAYATARGVHALGVVIDLGSALEGTIELGRGATVEGAVLGADGAAVPGASVRVVPLDRPASGRAGSNARLWAEPGAFEFYVPTVRTDGGGRYRVPGVPTPPVSGEVRRVVIAADAAGAWWRGDEFTADDEHATFTVDVRLGATPYVPEPEPVAEPIRVNGRVVDAATDAPIAGARVALLVPSADFASSHAAESGDDGRFAVAALWDGSPRREDLRLRVEADGHRSFRAKVADVGEVAVRLVPGQDDLLPGRVVGRIVGPDGAGVEGIFRLSFQAVSGQVTHHNVATGGDGRFTIEGVACNWWHVWVDHGGWTSLDVPEDGEATLDLRLDAVPGPPPPWTEEDDARRDEAHAELAEASAGLRELLVAARDQATSGTQPTETEQVARQIALSAVEERLTAAHALLGELDERRIRAGPRREVVVRGLTAPGRAWLVLQGRGERWVAEVRNGEARFAALAAATWDGEVVRRGASPAEFQIEVPAGTGPATIDAPVE